MAETSYDKQWKWKMAAMRKAEKMKSQAEENVGSFAPHIYTTNFQSRKELEPKPRAETHNQHYQPTNTFNSQQLAMSLEGMMNKSSELYPGYSMTQNTKDTRVEDHHGDELSSSSESDEPIVELLERERRQWQSEREKLIQCIHLQQLELSQRNLAAQERAVDIAKDFAKVIESFEERLINIETHVQREITSLKSIAEALLVAVGKSNNGLML